MENSCTVVLGLFGRSPARTATLLILRHDRESLYVQFHVFSSLFRVQDAPVKGAVSLCHYS
jgi:hypothetical protein